MPYDRKEDLTKFDWLIPLLNNLDVTQAVFGSDAEKRANEIARLSHDLNTEQKAHLKKFVDTVFQNPFEDYAIMLNGICQSRPCPPLELRAEKYWYWLIASFRGENATFSPTFAGLESTPLSRKYAQEMVKSPKFKPFVTGIGKILTQMGLVPPK